MFAKPQAEHQWLDRFIGEWSYESVCQMAPDQPSQTTSGQMEARSLGGMWLLAESHGVCPDNGTWNGMITLGYDPQNKQFVGSFVASMMSHFWPYAGTLDEAGRVLTLNSVGPKMTGTGTAKYRDSIEIENDNRWIMRSELQDDDGKWHSFMTATYRRKI